MNKIKFYVLSFTWGLPMTLIGCIVAGVLMLAGHRPKRWGYCWYFEVVEGWGGLEMGVFFLTCKNPTERTKNHELGHAIQNCYWGFLMPFVISIPSAIRYWYRVLTPNKVHPAYDSIWFEGQATKLGTELMKTL